MEYQEIVYELADGILLLRLNRPEKLNAFTTRMRDELLDALNRADSDDEVRAVVVTGGGRAFCAGADLGEGAGTFDYRDPAGDRKSGKHVDTGGSLSLRIFDLRKPIIAAINGPAVGIGITMTLPMDVRLAADTARIGFVFSRRGIVPEACSTWFLPRIVGISRAAEWVYSGRVFSAEEARTAGLVSRVVPPGELLAVSRNLARELVHGTSAVSVALSRQMLWRMLGARHPIEAHEVESRAMYEVGGMNDAREGVQSFLEKREPRFTLSPSRDLPEIWK